MFENRYITLNSIRTRYWQVGDAGSAVVLLAGLGCSVLEWQCNIAALAAGHRVYAFDLPGQGLSEKPDRDCYSIESLARFALDFLSARGEERAHLVGNSLGGRVALECARLAPARVQSLVVAAPAAVGRETAIAMRLAATPILGERLTLPSLRTTRELWIPAFFDASFVTDDFVETKYTLAALPGAQQAVLRTLRGFVSPGGFRRDQLALIQAALPTMSQPTLIMWGRQDVFIPPGHARILEAGLKRSRTVMFDACGHLPQLERALEFNATVLDFLAHGG